MLALGLGEPSQARDLRLATWDAGLTRDGPGLLLRDLNPKRKDPQVAAALQVIQLLDADVLVLTDIDYDATGAALAALQARLAQAGLDYRHVLAPRPNTGVPTGLDLDHDGALNGPADAQGWGRFPGQAGIAILSKYPLEIGAMRDFSSFLWKDLPGADLPPDLTPEAAAIQRLATAGFYDLPVSIGAHKLSLLIWAATPPVFDGPEDRNGRRNADETAFWSRLLDGALPFAAPAAPFVLIGQPNLDPMDGQGRPAALRALMADPRLQDPEPRAPAGRSDPGQAGDPALDTILMRDGTGLRLDMILPSADLVVSDASVLWPAPDDPLAAVIQAASSHRPVQVTIDWP